MHCRMVHLDFMSRTKKLPPNQTKRELQFETCEPRVMMTARSDAADFVSQYLAGSIATGRSTSPQFNFLPASLSNAHEQTGMDRVREDYRLNGAGQTVAIIDSGIAYDHLALGGGFGSNYRVVGGWDFTEGGYQGESNPYDDAPGGGHGTHVAGIVGSDDPDNLGVAPGVDLVAVRVFDDNNIGYFSWVEQALNWVYDHRNSFENPITTVNLSLGSAWNSANLPGWASLEDEFLMLKQVGIFISVAAGNDFELYGEPGLSYPAASPHVVPVMSTDSSGYLSYYSQRHDRAIAAPGQGIRSTVPDYYGDEDGQGDDYATFSGTSMAAPYIAGAAAIIRQALQQTGRVNIDQDMIYGIMRETADRIYDSITSAYYLRLNIKAAVDSVLGGDSEGNTRSEASYIGSFGLRKTVWGTTDYQNDRDFFSFKALRTGTVTLTVEGVEGAEFQLRRYYADGSSRYVNGNTISMTVKEGQTYSVCIRGIEGTGAYSAAFKLVPNFKDLGEVTETTIKNQRVNGEKWYCLTATEDGKVRTESWINRRTNDVRLELYDADMRKLATSDGRYKDNVYGDAACDDVFFVRLVGKNSEVKLRLTSIAVESEPMQAAHATQASIHSSATVAEQSTVKRNNYFIAPELLNTATWRHTANHSSTVSDRVETENFKDRSTQDFQLNDNSLIDRFADFAARTGIEHDIWSTALEDRQLLENEGLDAQWCDEALAELAA